MPLSEYKTVLITGASSGVGMACVRMLRGRGLDVVALARREERLEPLAEETGCRVLVQDLLDTEKIYTDLPDLGVDILINNAGALHWRPIIETGPKRYDLMMEVNARAAYATSYYALPHMLKQNSGTIIQMSPPIDMRMLPGKVGYCMSKFSMSLLALGIDAEVTGTEIKSCALWPATAIESQATINHELGGPESWRKPDILVDSVLAILRASKAEVSGQCFVDEELLESLCGLTDFSNYNCVEGGRPIRIVGDSASDAKLWRS